ncbi:hypothetical protein AB0L65_32830 [Nonomuraea sp. NPDC052116]|uniref:hypothetical protein n=1 Tax=Nonomuraea sp. NPDC052116 TaxID=3155665 RepID=UPI0034467E3F
MADLCAARGCTDEAKTRGLCESDYRKKIRMGIYGWVDPSEARAHVAVLRDLGWTWEQIAAAAGLSTYVPHQLGTGKTTRLRTESAKALLAVPLTSAASHRGINSTGTRRRVQALAWMGWPASEVARRAGTTANTLQTLILPTRQISIALARRVAVVYDELCLTPGPSKIAAGKARSLGFVSPMAWDDDTIDDPDTRPDLGEKVSRPQALAENADELTRQGYSLEQAAERLGVSTGYLRSLHPGSRRPEVVSHA